MDRTPSTFLPSASRSSSATLSGCLLYPATAKPWSAMFNTRLRPMTPRPIIPRSYVEVCMVTLSRICCSALLYPEFRLLRIHGRSPRGFAFVIQGPEQAGQKVC